MCTPDGQLGVFATLPYVVPGCPGGVGLTTAMVVLRSGWVIVGSLPSTDATIDTAGQGCLLELSPGRAAGRCDLRALPQRALGCQGV